MHWYNDLAALFAGAFFANTLPHFIKGCCGDRFPTPFSKPPGQGLSSPRVNVAWALANLLLAALLFHAGHLASAGLPGICLAFAGFAALSLQMSGHFAKKDAK